MSSNEESQRARLSPEQVQLVAFKEQRFWESGSSPSDEIVALALSFPLEKVRKLQDETVRRILLDRGIESGFDVEKVFLPIQIAAVNMMCNAYDKRSMRQKADELGIKIQTWNAWMRQPSFRKYVSVRTEELLKGLDVVADVSLAQLVEERDLSAIKFYKELQGIYNPRIQVDFNLDSVLARVVDIITRHVKDPIALNAIADEIQVVLTGKAIERAS